MATKLLCPDGFTIIDEIARTDRAIVYKARDTSDDQFVALKLVQNDDTGHHELDMLRRVQKANRRGPVHVVHYLGHDEDGPDLWIALEHFHETLDKLDAAKMTPLALMSIALDSAKGLVEMERAGVVDDDVKPENLAFKAQSGRVAHIDLGCARLSGQKPLGSTPDYVAPEILAGEPSDTSPCYGWARTMEFLCVGRVGLGPEYRLDEVVPWVGAAFSRTVHNCADADPCARPSPRDLYDAVKRIVGVRERCGRCNSVRFCDGRCCRCRA